MKYIGLYSDPQDIATKANVDAVGDRVTTAESDIDALETAVAGKQATITGGATTIASSNLTAGRALVSDSNGKVAVSAVTSTELGYIDGVTSNVQTQLNAKVPTTRKVNNKALSADITLTASDVGALPSTTAIPSKTSDLTNDSGFITSSNVPAYTIVKSEDSGDYAAIYYLTKDGVNTGAAINIPKDLFVESGSIVENPTGYPDGKYLKLVLQNQETPIYINVADLVDAYTAGNGIAVSADNVISAKVVTSNGLSLTSSGITMSVASTSANGAMSSTDKSKLDGIESGAQKNTITSVNSKTGAVVLTQDDVGDGTTYVRTQNDFTDDLKTQIGTNKSNISSLTTTVSGKQATITGAATTITSSNLTASRVLVSNSSGKVAVSDVTSTELGYLDGVTSNIQTQLNKKLETAPVTSVNSKTGAVSLAASDVGAVPTTRTVNSKALSANITLTASDVGALPDTTVVPTKTSQLTNDSGFVTGSYIPTSGGTATGAIVAPSFQTGTDEGNYFQTKKMRGEGDANTYYHAIDFGYSGHNQVDFYEYGGTWNFYENTGGKSDSGTLVGSIKPTGWNGGAALTGTPTAPTAAKGTNTTQIATTAFVATAVANTANIVVQSTQPTQSTGDFWYQIVS